METFPAKPCTPGLSIAGPAPENDYQFFHPLIQINCPKLPCVSLPRLMINTTTVLRSFTLSLFSSGAVTTIREPDPNPENANVK
jgi:hypothetical protein